MLADAAVRGAVDELRGLKESVIIGKLIPVGTGCRSQVRPESQLPTDGGRGGAASADQWRR